MVSSGIFVFRAILITLLLLLVDYYAYGAVKTVLGGLGNNKYKLIAGWVYWGVSLLFYVAFIISFFVFGRGAKNAQPFYTMLFSYFLVFFIPKLVTIVFLAGEDVFRLLKITYDFVSVKIFFVGNNSIVNFESRRKFISSVAMGVAAVPFAFIWHGIAKGKYNFKIHTLNLSFSNLPNAFHNLKIVQISDLHIGSFTDDEPLKKAVQMINNQEPDVVFFTGDLVNNIADEAENKVKLLSEIKARYGKYSILGNHDYGDYVSWESPEAKSDNLKKLIRIQEEMGFKMLLNESTELNLDGDSIAIAGVENWGAKGFAKYGDINRTLQNIRENDFTILLSHDPSHWDYQVKQHAHHVHLTLSGHTHGMQFGVEIPGIKFSPVQWVYKKWAGLYNEKDKYLYVNRGLGFIGFSGRVGIWPEITVIRLQKA